MEQRLGGGDAWCQANCVHGLQNRVALLIANHDGCIANRRGHG